MKKSCFIQHRLLSLSFMIVLLFGANIAAKADVHTFTVDGIRYGYDDNDPDNAIVYALSSGYYEGDVVIPETVTNTSGTTFNVIGINSYAFSYCENLTSVTLPSSLTSIDNRAFQDCTGLTEITIPSSVTSIGSRVFSGCTNLKKVTFEGSANSEGLTMKTETVIPSAMFKDCPLEELYLDRDLSYDTMYSPFRNFTSITTITFGENISSISAYAFWQCSGIESIEFPSNITSIADNAFYGVGLTEIEVPSSIEDMGASVFAYCSSLTKATVHGVLGESAFSNCTELIDLSISEGVTSIGESAFKSCVKLPQITIPKSVTTFGSSVCDGCVALEKAEVYCSANIRRTFYGCTALKEVTLENITGIDQNTFRDCSSLTEIIIPETVTFIGSWAFSGTGITEISIPKYVSSVEIRPFMDSTLQTIYIYPRLDETNYSNLFEDFTCYTIFAHKDQLETIESAYSKGTNYYAFEDVYTLSAENVYSGSIKLKVEADEDLLNDYVSIVNVILQEEGSGTSITATLESGDELESIYVAKNLSPNTTYTCTLTFLFGSEEFTCEVTATTSNIVLEDGITLIDQTTSSATFKITLSNDDPYSTLERYGLAYITDSNTAIFYADEEGIVTVEGLSEGTEYTLYVYVQYGDTPIVTNESITFTTKATILPTVQTLEAIDITHNSATLKGSVVKGDDEITGKGFEYWLTEDKKEIVPITGDEISATIDGLTPTTTYTYCVYATTEKGTYVGDTITFTTLYDVESAYILLTEEIKEVIDELENVWSEITTNYADVVEEVQDDYDAISDELSEIQQKVKDAYENSTIDDDFVEEIKDELSSISPKIEELLSSAEVAETDYLYSKIKDEIKEVLDNLNSVWEVITTDYEDVVEELKEDYDAIFLELNELTQTIEGAYNNGEFDKELVETIESSLEEITQEIENLITKADEAEINFLYSKIKEEINDALGTLNSAWEIITSVDEDVAEELKEDYDVIFLELSELTKKVEEAYNNGEFDKNLVETLESSLDEITQEIEELLTSAGDAETSYLYNKVSDEIKETQSALNDTWTTITTDYPDVADELEDDYKAIVEELSSLAEGLEDAYTSGELDKELVETIESSLEEISQEIEDLLTTAKKTDINSYYNMLVDEINKAQDALEEAWDTITNDCADVADEFEDDYKVIATKLTSLSQEMEDISNEEITRELLESIESRVEEITQEIEALLSSAKDAETSYLYNNVSDEIKKTQGALEEAWETITTDYADVADELEDDYKAIVDELSSLEESLEDAYNSGEVGKELAESIESSLEEIAQEIEELLTSAGDSETSYLYNKVSDEIKESQNSLDDTWATITTDYPDVADELEDDYKAIAEKLSDLAEGLEETYTKGELDKEVVETIESSLEEISQEIEDLLTTAKKTDIISFYNMVLDEIKEAQSSLEEAWAAITTDCADVADEFEADYKVIDTKLTSLSQEMVDIYNEGITRELIESIESRVEEISQEIDALLSSATDAETSYLYDKVSGEIKDTEDALDDAWTTITTDYADVADEFEDDYKAILEDLSEVAEEFEEAYNAGELDKELAESIEESLEEINQEIEDLLAAAKQEHTSGISSIFIDFGDDVQIYNLNGSRVQNAEKGKIYIIRYSDGTTRKVFAK